MNLPARLLALLLAIAVLFGVAAWSPDGARSSVTAAGPSLTHAPASASCSAVEAPQADADDDDELDQPASRPSAGAVAALGAPDAVEPRTTSRDRVRIHAPRGPPRA